MTMLLCSQYEPMPLTENELFLFKTYFPEDKELEAVTLQELSDNTNGLKVDWTSIRHDGDGLLEGSELTCGVNIGFVVFDCICLFIGAVSLRSSLSKSTAELVGKAAEPVISQLEEYIRIIGNADSSKSEVGQAVFNVVATIYSGGCLGAVISAFCTGLTTYQYILYGATAVGTITAACATDGVAIIGAILVELATVGFLTVDAISCVKECDF